MLQIGILSIQGDITEHVSMMKEALKEKGMEGKVSRVKSREKIKKCDGLIIPGGESTTISRFMEKEKLAGEIRNLAQKRAIMGTCAGSILLAKDCDDQRINLLKLMDMKVNRNAYGRQRESFEAPLEINGMGKFSGVFIRAPMIEKAWGKAEIMASYEGKPVIVKQGNLLALTFHPELTQNTKIHEYFLSLI